MTTLDSVREGRYFGEWNGGVMMLSYRYYRHYLNIVDSFLYEPLHCFPSSPIFTSV